MITNPHSTPYSADDPRFSIKDSLLRDALERNRLTKPPRLMPKPWAEHPISKPAVDQEPHASK